MAVRIALILLAALLLELLGNVAIAAWQERELISTEKSRRLAERLVIAERLALDTPAERRQRIITDLRTDGLTFNWVPATVLIDSSASTDLRTPIQRLRLRTALLAQG